MTWLWDLLDGLPLGPVALFAFGWLVLLGLTLAIFRSRREPDRCTRCGSTWQRTKRGGQFHLCTPPGRLGARHGAVRDLDGLGERVHPSRRVAGQP